MTPDNEQRRQNTIRHIRILARRKGGKVSVSDYLAYRRQHKTANLPSGTTLYRMFGKFSDLLEEAGINSTDKATSPRKRREDMITDLQYVAKQLELDTLSTHAYDRFREEHKTRPGLDEEGNDVPVRLSSSSVIRKWLGRWGTAVVQAGLKSSERAQAPKPTEIEAIDALRQAKEAWGGRLTPAAYQEFREQLPDDQRARFPSAGEILELHFPNWEAALKVADIEQGDAIHERALYTATEIRRLVRHCEALLRKHYSDPAYQLEQRGYEFLRSHSDRPLPEWDVIVDMMRF